VGSDGSDTVLNAAILQFTDHTLTFARTPDVNLLESYRFYKAAFDRTPDYGGLGYWYNNINHGAAVTSVANSFIGSDEFKKMYGDNPSDSTFVTELYQHAFGRTPDQNGYDFWVNDLKVETRAQVLTHFSESAEIIAKVAGIIAGPSRDIFDDCTECNTKVVDAIIKIGTCPIASCSLVVIE